MQNLLILSCFVAGVQFRIRDDGLRLDEVLVDNLVSFVKDEANPYDPDAIRVMDETSQQCIGFVPREQTPILHEAWAAGLTILGKVTGRSMDVSKGKAIIIQARLS